MFKGELWGKEMIHVEYKVTTRYDHFIINVRAALFPPVAIQFYNIITA